MAKPRIHPSAQIAEGVIIQDDVYIGPFCIIGYPAESKKYWPVDYKFGAKSRSSSYSVVIRRGTVIHGHATIDGGTEQNTIIGQDCFIMKGVHIGHDAQIHDGVTMAPHVIIGGHSVIGQDTNMGMGSIVHQRVHVPGGCMIGMGTIVTKKSQMAANNKYIGAPARYLGPNKRPSK